VMFFFHFRGNECAMDPYWKISKIEEKGNSKMSGAFFLTSQNFKMKIKNNSFIFLGI
jgi:hypothetical protein